MLRHFCPRCRQPIYEAQTTGESGIYGSQDVSDLCEPCFFDEDKEIEDKGTNDLPATHEIYRKNDRELNR